MNVLMITGDRRFGPGQSRFDIQAAAVQKLVPLYWGRGSLWPRIPKEKFDVVTAQDPLLRGAFARRVANTIGARLNIQVHMDLDVLPLWKRAWGGFNLRRADSIRVVSEKIKKQVEALGVHAPITVLPVFVDLEKFKHITPVPHEQKTILWTGRFEDEKDPLLALKVIQQVPGAKLIMLGAGGLESSLRAQTGRLNLPVEFPGWQDPLDYLSRADVVLCTSRHESWGASIVEALAAGVPVVAPDVGIAKEAGATVVPREGFAEAVVDILHTGPSGRLQLPLLGKEEWSKAWRNSL